MKRTSILLALALVVAMTLPAAAEVEEITVGGSIQVRGQVLTPGVDPGGITLVPGALPGDPVTIVFAPASSFNNDVSGLDWVTQRTRVNVDAKLSGGVGAFVELQAFDFWGLEDVERDITDVTASGVGDPFTIALPFTGFQGFPLDENPPIDLYQAYIEMNDIADYPISVRVGRQELSYGREWLVGNNDAGVNFSGLAFDGIKASYEADEWQVDAWWARVADLSTPLALGGLGLDLVTGPGGLVLVTAVDTFAGVEEDADIDFYGVYGTYTGLEDLVIDGYYLGVRDARANPIPGADTDFLHTIGARVAGVWELGAGTLDANGEAAFQFGNNAIDGDYEGWAVNIVGGYTFDDVQWTPRIEGEYAYFSGDDDLTDDDVGSFIRMFSDVHYGEMNVGGNLDQLATNLHIFKFGASAEPAEKLTVSGDFYYLLLAEDDNDGLGITFGLPQVFGTSVDDNVGYEVDLAADYQYTEDLNLRVGWAHFFADDAIKNSWGAGDDDDVDYVYVQAALVF